MLEADLRAGLWFESNGLQNSSQVVDTIERLGLFQIVQRDKIVIFYTL